MTDTTHLIKTLQPIGTLVLVKLEGETNKTPSGILIPDMSVERPQEGEVVRVGWKSTDVANHFVKIGDRVMLPKFGGTELQLNGLAFKLIEEADILGRVQWIDPTTAMPVSWRDALRNEFSLASD